MATQEFISNATKIFNEIDQHAQFIVIHKYQNKEGEIADYNVCWRISYENAVLRGLNLLKELIIEPKLIIGKTYSLMHLEQAKEELINSLTNTLMLGTGNNPLATSADSYDSVKDKFGKIISGVKLHRDQDILHLSNVYRLNKVVHVPGIYKTVNSAFKTLAKNDLRAYAKLNKFGQFKLESGKFEKISVQKLTMTDEDFMRL